MYKRIVSIILVISIVFVFSFNMISNADEDNNINIDQARSTTDEYNFANVVLFAHFAGEDAEEDSKFFEENRDTIINMYEGTHGRSVVNYLNTISYGKFKLKNVFPQDDGVKIVSYELPLDKEIAYQQNIDLYIIQNFLKNVPEISDEVLDYDGDGYLDNLTIVLRGGEEGTSSGTTFVSHKGDYFGTEEWSGKRIGTYNILNTYTMLEAGLNASESAVIAHEFLHSLGFPDLYRSSGTDYPVYTWDIMALANVYMSYPLAYLRMKFGRWLDINTVTTSQDVTLELQSSNEGNRALILESPLNEYELFVIEFRKKPDYVYGDKDSLDRGIGGSGIIVYRIDTTVESLSNNFGETGVYVFRPNVAPEGYADTEISRVINAYLSEESGRTTIGSSDMDAGLEDGALTFSDGTNSGIVISNVSSSSGDKMTCTVTIPKKEDFDMWEDTNYSDLTDQDVSVQKSFCMTTHNNKEYVISYSNNKIYTQSFNGTEWNREGNILTVDEQYGISQMQVKEINNNLYLIYSTWGSIKIKKWNEALLMWEDYSTIENTNGDFSSEQYEEELYIAVVDEKSSTSRLIKVSENGNKELGIYFQDDFCGQPKIVIFDNEIYVTIRKSTGNLIKLYKYTDGLFEEIQSEMSSNTYDVVAVGSKMYFSLGKSNDENLKLYIYSEDGWETVESDISYGFPSLIVAQEKLYMLATTTEENGNAKVYKYDENKKIFIQEGTDVDGAATQIKMISGENVLYAAVERATTGKIVVKRKAISESNILYLRGDINQDGRVSVADAICGAKGLAGSEPLTDEQKAIGDVNDDGRFGVSDLIKIAKFLAEIIDVL